MCRMYAQLSSNLHYFHNLLWCAPVPQYVLRMKLETRDVEVCSCAVKGTVYKLLYLLWMSAFVYL